MKGNWFSILVITVLFGLLVLLATYQYKWVGQIGDSDKVRLSARLNDDTARFAEDFNREIQSIYFSFQLDPENIDKKDWRAFTKRYFYWKSQTKLPDAVKDFYFIGKSDKTPPLRFEAKAQGFQEALWNDDLRAILAKVGGEKQVSPVYEKDGDLALIVPIFDKADEQEQVFYRENEGNTKVRTRELHITRTDNVGFLIVILNENVIGKKLLAGLANKYFANNDDSNYDLSVTNSNRKIIFGPNGKAIGVPDSTTQIFNLEPRDFAFFPDKTGNTIIESQIREDENGNIVVSETSQSKEATIQPKTETVDVTLERSAKSNPQIAIFKNGAQSVRGIWTLNVQHKSGSIDAFIKKTRSRNLVISFGILALLAISMVLIFALSQRSKRLAQRQVDFVSSVTHEFRTPLSVIHSAGENLSDGVIHEKERISKYGNLIKSEGKKLSGMVEQILEFAGANSGKRKYDLRLTDVRKIVDDALAECSHTIRKSGFVVETLVSEDLPRVMGDEKALTQAIQNIINNSLKYSNGNKWLRITAKDDSRWVKIIVEDRGIGINSKDLKQMFEPFYRSKSVIDEQISGNGLGLSLVKQIIDGHGGKVEVESTLGSGSKFTVSLPVSGA